MKSVIAFLAFFAASLALAQPHIEQGNSNPPPNPQAGEQGWYRQKGDISTGLHIHFINRDTGWAGTNYTTDGGENWLSQPDARRIMQFVDGLHGWSFSPLGGQWISRTTDGGKTWVDYNMTEGNDRSYVDAVKFYDSLHGYVAFHDGYVSATHDGGKTWKVVHSRTDNPYALGCFDSLHVMVGGGSDGERVYVSVTGNGGDSWTRLEYPKSNEAFNDFAVLDSVSLVAVGSIIIRTYNRGQSWKVIRIQKGWESISATDSNNMTVVGFGGAILRTKDGWNTYEFQNSGVTYDLYDVCFVDSSTGWAVGGANILHTSDAGKSWVRQHLPIPIETSVSPEPFSQKTTISYNLPKPAKVSIHIYDVTGRELKVLESPGIQDAGLHTIEFDAGAYPQGVFYYKLSAPGIDGFGKMTKISF